MQIHRLALGLLAVVMGAVFTLSGANAPGAQAATIAGNGWNYISLPTWLGNCPGGGSVKELWVSVGDTWSGGDRGDDLVYAEVRMDEDQTVVAQGLCINGSRSYMGPASSNTIHPTRQNQTWWVGPAGTRHN